MWFRWSNSEDGTGNLGEVSGSGEANVTQFLSATDVLSTLSTTHKLLRCVSKV